MAIFNRDYRRIAELHVQAGWMPSHIRIDELEAAARSVCEPYFTRPLSEISLAEVLIKLFRTAQRYELTLQPQLILLQKTLLNIEGVGRLLDPKLDIWAVARPVLERILVERYSPQRLANEFRKRLPEMITHAPDMPRLLHAWLTQQVEGKHELQMRSQRPGANWRGPSTRRAAPHGLRDPRHRPADRRGGAVRLRSRRPARLRHSGGGVDRRPRRRVGADCGVAATLGFFALRQLVLLPLVAGCRLQVQVRCMRRRDRNTRHRQGRGVQSRSPATAGEGPSRGAAVTWKSIWTKARATCATTATDAERNALASPARPAASGTQIPPPVSDCRIHRRLRLRRSQAS